MIVLNANEIIEKIENGEINWDNVYNYKVSKETMPELLRYIATKDSSQMAKKILMNSLYGAMDNDYFVFNNRDMSASITFIGRTMIRLTGLYIQQKMESLFGKGKYIIYTDTDSVYFDISPFIEKVEEKMGINWDTSTREQKEKILQSAEKFINKIIIPTTQQAIDDLHNIMNVSEKGFMGFKVEKINIKGLWVAKKKYALLTIWNEGKILIDKPKLSVTGLEIIRSSTPEFCIDKLEVALLKIINDEKDIVEFLDETKKEFFKMIDEDIEKVSITMGVSNMDYKKDEKGWYRINENGVRIACPINSRAALLHNKIVEKYGLWDTYPKINEGDKIKYAILKMPNPVGENVIGFISQGILYDTDIIKYVDKEKMWENNFMSPLNILLKASGIDITKKNDISEWF